MRTSLLLTCAAMALFSACAVDDARDDEIEVSVTEAALLQGPVVPLWPDDGSVPTRDQFLKTTLDLPAVGTNIPAFDSLNRASIRDRSGTDDVSGFVRSEHLGGWSYSSFEGAIAEASGCDATPNCEICYRHGGGELTARIVFDRDDRMYTAIQAATGDEGGCDTPYVTYLLSSTNRGISWNATAVASADVSFTLEHEYSPEPLEGPPAMLLWTYEGRVAFCDPNDPDPRGLKGQLDLVRPTWINGSLVIPPPQNLTMKSSRLSAHSGGGTQVLTKDGVVYAAWAEVNEEVTDEPSCGDDVDPLPEVCCVAEDPAYYSSVMAAKIEGADIVRSQAGKAYPVNDDHNRPAIVLDTADRLHVITGTHNCPFVHARAGTPGSITTWIQTTTIEGATPGICQRSPAKQTYPAFLRDRYDRLHLTYRRTNRAGDYYALYYKHTNDDGSWGDETMLAQPPTLPDGGMWGRYGIWYHQTAIDHHGWLYTLFSWYTTKTAAGDPFHGWFFPADNVYKYAAILVSKDGGASWDYAKTKTFDDATYWDPASGALADLDGNGMKDAVHVYWDEGLNVHVDNATGTPAAWSWKNRGVRLTDGEKVLQYPVLAGNVNASVNGQTDTRDDLVFVYYEPSTSYLVLRTHFARPDGRFDVHTSTQTDGKFGLYPSLMGDVTGDGNADVVMSYRRNCGLSIRTKASLGNGEWDTYTQCFSSATMPTSVHQYPTRIGKVARANATSPDPRADLVYMFRDADDFLYTRVLRSDGNGAWTQLPDQKHNDGSGINQYPHLLGDLDNDGKDDLVFVFRHWKGGAFVTRVMYGKGDGTFTGSYQLQYANVPPEVPGYDAMIGDVNNDRCADVVFPYRAGSDDHYRVYTLVSSCQMNGQFTATTSPAMP